MTEVDEPPRAWTTLLLPPGVQAPGPGPDDETLADLNLDRVLDAVLAGHTADDRLTRALRTPLPSADAVAFRQAVLRDLATRGLADLLRAFVESAARVGAGLRQAARARHVVQRHLAHLTSASEHVAATRALAEGLAAMPPGSTALSLLAAHARAVSASPAFAQLSRDAAETRAALREAVFRLQIRGNRLTLGRGDGDASSPVTEAALVWQPFLEGDPRPRVLPHPAGTEPDALATAIVERTARLHPAAFAALERFAGRHPRFTDDGLATAARELPLYLGAADWAARLDAAGMPTCLPHVADADVPVRLLAAYDADLALQHAWDDHTVVPNDVELRPGERVIVVTGPNQGGKTTFARAVGQVMHLAAVGLPVPAREAELALPDRVATSFARGEELRDLQGALARDLSRTRHALADAGPRTLVVLNEVFSSTTVQDALLLSRRTLDLVRERGCVCVCVTFLDALAQAGPPVVSYVSQVDPDDPTVRTHRVVRQATGGPTYAEVLARAHGLDRSTLARRLAR